jgi:hemerythrin superfamily protein
MGTPAAVRRIAAGVAPRSPEPTTQEAIMADSTTAGTDVVDELTADHREVTALLDELLATTDPKARRDMADMAITEVVRHSVAEEMYVYPVMRDQVPDGEKEVAHDVEEHKDLERTMKELEGCDAGDPRFLELVREFRGKLHHHATDEETEQFPKLRASVPREKLVQMREQVERAKKLAPTRAHPAAPNSELFHKLVGPGVGLMDRVRDKLTGRNTG